MAPNDALAVINYLNAFGAGAVPDDAVAGAAYYDTNGDNFVSADDCLSVINHLNAFGPDIESSPEPEGEPADRLIQITDSRDESRLAKDSQQLSLDELISILGMDVALQPRRQK